ncbi:MAG: glycoside hydrolase family 2 [Paludibacter sp.]|nr:glycoside hydrolase family 2 [Paludibacter sp.]
MLQNLLRKTSFLLILLLSNQLISAQQSEFKTDFSNSATVLKTIGRGTNKIENGVLKSKDAYSCFGNAEWKNYSIKFKARAPKGADQVQIWAGFRAFNRYDRYVVGLRGGLQNTLYLSRMGYMGTDEFLGLRPLYFQPKPGKWYDVKIEVCGNRIRVFLNNESAPYIDILDKNASMAPSGEVTLGGSWIETEFDDLVITPLTDDYLKNTPVMEVFKKLEANEKEKKRIIERASYKPLVISEFTNGRTEISLNGQWLFMPEHEMKDAKKASQENAEDNNWHTMSVPNFWNPSRIWLHGEMFDGHAKGVSDVYFQQETDRCANYTFDYTTTKVAWYRQWIELPTDLKSKHITLNFDAVSKIGEVYINGQLAGSHIGMFGDFSVDGSKLFKPGKNLIAVRVVRDFIENIEDGEKIVDVAVTVPVTNNMLKDIAHGFFKENPAGIWQPVKMVISDKVKIEDVYIKPTLEGATFDVTIKNHSTKSATYDLTTEILDKETKSQLYAGTTLKKLALKAGEERKVTFSLSGLKPRLWSPNHPNLYDFNFKLVARSKEIDNKSITSGFRTFETKNEFFYLNGNQYWLRGANHTPYALAPNDVDLANTFFQLMKSANMDVTRTHTSPYNETWTKAADENGIGISYEGTWPWLMIQSSMPDEKLIKMWADEFLGMLKKYRNHPSILFWTVNNEMKFYDNEPDIEVAKQKMKIISDVVKRMRETDPTRPICFDSNYKRIDSEVRFGKDFYKNIDDGDIDDDHKYINWYAYTLFRYFKGHFQSKVYPGRPLISQELSTGYPNGETGHATRFYNLVHQNPQSLIGYQSYEYANPQAFLDVNSFITGEIAEALRRTGDKTAGVLHFALLTWFRNVYDAKNIEPYPTYYAMKRAMQPVLVSAEIWGRNLYAGEMLPTRICVVNDKENGAEVGETKLYWELQSECGDVLVKGSEIFPAVKHSTRQWITPNIQIPENLPSPKIAAKLKLKLTENGVPISENEYKLNIAQKEWSYATVNHAKKIALVDFNGINKAMDFLKVKHTTFTTLSAAFVAKPDLYIVSGIDSTKCTQAELAQLRTLVDKGAKVLLLNSPDATKKLYPEYITGWIVPTEGDIVNMEVPESPVFDGIGLFDIRYFNNNKAEIPTVCKMAFQINRSLDVIELANQTKIHGYIVGEMMERSEYVKTIKGFSILRINKGGSAIVSGMNLEKATTDPIAGRLLVNMINDLLNN